MLQGAQLGLLGVTLFFLCAVASMLEGLEMPLLRLRAFALTASWPWESKEQHDRKKAAFVPLSKRARLACTRASQVVLVISRLLVSRRDRCIHFLASGDGVLCIAGVERVAARSAFLWPLSSHS